jgi:hypothetical protein
MATVKTQTVGKQNAQLVGMACPYCQDRLRTGDSVVVCPKCQTPHHVACWRENGNHCTVFGCSTTASIAGTTTAPPPVAPVYEPSVMTQATNTIPSYTPTAGGTTSAAPPAPRPINVTLFQWLALLLAVFVVHTMDSWNGAIIAASAVASILAVFVEYRRLGGAVGLAPHINFICGLAVGALVLALLPLAWDYAVDAFPSLDRYSYWFWVGLVALSVYIGAWGSSRVLTADSAGLVRWVAGLYILYWVGGRLEKEGYSLLIIAIGSALAAVLLLILGLWDDGLVFDPGRVAGALLGALTLSLLVVGLDYLLFEQGYLNVVPFGQSVLRLPLTWRLLLALLAIFGASEGGASFAVGLWRFLARLAVLLAMLGLIYLGGSTGLRLAQENLSPDLELLGLAVGAVVGLVVAVMTYRAIRSLFK